MFKVLERRVAVALISREEVCFLESNTLLGMPCYDAKLQYSMSKHA